MLRLFVFVLSLTLSGYSLANDFFIGNTVFNIPVKNWKSMRDNRIVKQSHDDSCGASSVATILTEYYRLPTKEKKVLTLLENVATRKGYTSFDDIRRILPDLGFRGVGLATSWEQLADLKIPVIVYVKHRKQDHFTVVNGISKKRIRLSDPSLGNQTLTRGQFKKIWETRDEKGLEGKMLAILPLDKDIAKNPDGSFFVKPSGSKLAEDLVILKQVNR